MKNTLLLITLIFVICFAGFSQQKPEQKITAEEIVAKHLTSIGTPEDIAAIKSRVFIGEATTTNAEPIVGTVLNKDAWTAVQFAAEGQKILLVILSGDKTKPMKVAYDGKEQTIGAGSEEFLANFLKTQKTLTKEGFFSGALSAAWPLLDLKAAKIKLAYDGIVERNGRSFYALKYTPHENFRISLYFEKETFRHVTTEYEYTVTPSVTSITSSVKVVKYKLTEEFSDFKIAGKLTLPFTYKIKVSSQNTVITPSQVMGPGLAGGQDAAARDENAKSILYIMNFKEVYYDEVLDPAVFKVS